MSILHSLQYFLQCREAHVYTMERKLQWREASILTAVDVCRGMILNQADIKNG